jgi:hypothetical protein
MRIDGGRIASVCAERVEDAVPFDVEQAVRINYQKIRSERSVECFSRNFGISIKSSKYEMNKYECIIE